MAAIAPKAVLVLFLAATAGLADTHTDVLRALNRVTTGLSDNDPKAALDAFDPSFQGFEQLSGYFQNLASAYSISNEADVVDEDDGSTEAKLTLDWSLTLRSLSSGETLERRKQVHVVLRHAANQWTIVDLTPIDLFDPQHAAVQ